jgi:hypothetical protein
MKELKMKCIEIVFSIDKAKKIESDFLGTEEVNSKGIFL